MKAPVTLCIFNRPHTTRRVFEAVRQARPETLFVVADGPRPGVPEDIELCDETRRIATTVDWDCDLRLQFADSNLGLARRMYTGISWVFEQVGESIILEDDCLPAHSFFPFCDELLDRYRQDRRLMAVTSQNFQPRNTCAPYSYYFSRYPHCWGWATWRRAWQMFDFAMPTWPEARASGWLQDWFSDPVSADFWDEIFEGVYRGRIHSWAYRYIYTCFLHGGLTAIPAVNLVSNIGFDATATHCKQVSPLADRPVRELEWPLRAPPFVFRARRADTFTQEAIYEDRLPVRRVLVNASAVRREGGSYRGEVERQESTRLGDSVIPAWAAEMAGLTGDDAALPFTFSGPSACLNRARLAWFLSEFSSDSDVRDFVILDLVAAATAWPLSGACGADIGYPLVGDAVRLWEQVWLYKVLGLGKPGHDVLAASGMLSHLAVLAAAAGNRVTCLQPERRTGLSGIAGSGDAGVGGELRQIAFGDLGSIEPESLDRIACVSALNHLAGATQADVLRGMARALRPGGIIGLTFDYGPPAPGADVFHPPPHEPPGTPEEVFRRYAVNGLEIAGGEMLEVPIPGSLFRDGRLQHSVGAIFLSKPPVTAVTIPAPANSPVVVAPAGAGELLYRGFRVLREWEQNTSRIFSRMQRAELSRTDMQVVAEERLAVLSNLEAALHAEKRQSEIYRAAAEERLKALLETDAALKAERAARGNP